MAAGTVSIDFKADTKAFTPAVEAANRALQQTEKQVERTSRAAGEAANAPGGLKALKGALGEQSDLGMFMKLFMGAGAVGAIGMAARMMGDVGQKAGEFAEQMRRGTLAAEDLPGAIIGSLPVLGELQRAAMGIWTALSGVGNVATEGMEAQAALTRQLRAQADMARATNEQERARVQAANDYRVALEQISAAESRALKEGTASPELIAKQVAQQREYAAAVRDAKLAEAEKAKDTDGRAILDQLNSELEALIYTREQLRELKIERANLTDAERQAARAKLDELALIEKRNAALAAEKKLIEAQADAIRELADQHAAWQARVVREIEALERAAEGPAEKLERTIAHLEELRASGLSDRAYQAAAEQAVREAEAAMNPQRPAGQLQFVGVEDAWKSFATAAAAQRDPATQAAQQTARNTGEQAKAATKANEVLGQINAVLQAAFGPTGGIVAVFG